MQLALAAGSSDHGIESDAKSASRTTRLMAAGIALAGAGAIAVNPVAPLVPVAGTHHAAVELTATTSENIDLLLDRLDGPNPIFSALGELSRYYGDIASDSLQRSWAGIESLWYGGGAIKGLENTLPDIIEFLKEGDTTHAWNLINNDMVFGAQAVFRPLFDYIPRGATEEIPGILGISADLSQVWANVQYIFDDFSFWQSAAKSVWEPWVGFQFALAENFNFASDHPAQDPIDALLNGYIVWNEDGGPAGAPWQGLLTSNGTFAYFFDKLPNLIADALTSTIADTDAGSAAADVSLLDTGAADASGYDLGDLLAGLFN